MRTILAAAAGGLALALASGPSAGAEIPKQLLLSVDFAPRTATQIEVGDFHFAPGQPAPIHYHAAPVVGYVSKGTIIYQVDGQAPQILKAGDAFYEPVGPRIMRFDNASKTEEAVFTDFNIEEPNQPFIVFPKPPTEKIDRRAFPTTRFAPTPVRHAEAYAMTVTGSPVTIGSAEPTVGYVAAGTVTVAQDDAAPSSFATGQSFAIPPNAKHATIAATRGTAKVVTFDLR